MGWRDFLISLKTRGLRGVEFAVTDDHDGLRRTIGEILPEAVWQLRRQRRACQGIRLTQPIAQRQ